MFAVNRYVLCVPFTNDNVVMQTDRMEDRFEGVVTVLAFADDIQIKINFRVGANP